MRNIDSDTYTEEFDDQPIKTTTSVVVDLYDITRAINTGLRWIAASVLIGSMVIAAAIKMAGKG